MGKLKDLTGQRFGRLVVISLNIEESSKPRGKNGKRRSYWNCKCDCGNEKVVCGADLKRGRINSCGCYKKDKMKEMLKEKWQDEEYRQMQSEQRRRLNEEMWKDEELRQMQSDKMREMVKEKWQDEEFRQKQSEIHSKMTGENSSNWKGGITPIRKCLRNLPIVEQWRKDTYIRENNRCQLTGKHVHGGNSDVHHLYGFNMIVLEAHTINAIEIKKQVKDYNEEELHKLEEYVTSWHKDTSNAVLLCDEVHDLFHNCKDKDGNVLYGYGNNTSEQFEEFKQRYLNGEFDDLLGDDLND